MLVKVYTDGAARGNPDGPGGYGAVLEYVDGKGQLHTKELSQGYTKTTNNRMELMAVIAGKGWKRGGNEPVKNVDLWKRLLEVKSRHQVTFHWVKGHDGHPQNERCDQLATTAADGNELIVDEGLE